MWFKKNWSVTMLSACAVVMLMSAAAVQPATGVKPDTATVVVPAKHLRAQTTCPVTGDLIDKKQYVDYNGKRIYLCCANCIAKVKADPEKYIRKVEGAGQSVEVAGKDAVVVMTDTLTNTMLMKNMVATPGSGANTMHMKNMAVMSDTADAKIQMKSLKTSGDTVSQAADTGYWTCPMHPAVHKAGPGQCPICSMNLVHKKAVPPVKK